MELEKQHIDRVQKVFNKYKENKNNLETFDYYLDMIRECVHNGEKLPIDDFVMLNFFAKCVRSQKLARENNEKTN